MGTPMSLMTSEDPERMKADIGEADDSVVTQPPEFPVSGADALVWAFDWTEQATASIDDVRALAEEIQEAERVGRTADALPMNRVLAAVAPHFVPMRRIPLSEFYRIRTVMHRAAGVSSDPDATRIDQMPGEIASAGRDAALTPLGQAVFAELWNTVAGFRFRAGGGQETTSSVDYMNVLDILDHITMLDGDNRVGILRRDKPRLVASGADGGVHAVSGAADALGEAVGDALEEALEAAARQAAGCDADADDDDDCEDEQLSNGIFGGLIGTTRNVLIAVGVGLLLTVLLAVIAISRPAAPAD